VSFAEDLGRRAALAVDNARLYRDAQAALHLRDEFLASISHDLRTPLTSMMGLTQLSLRHLDRLAIPETQRVAGALTNVERAMGTMATMVDQLLDLSRLQSGRPLDLHCEPLDLVSLVVRLAEEHQRSTSAHDIRVKSAALELEGVWDAVRVERVLSNLLSNAIKYSPNGGRVNITIEREEDSSDGRGWAVVTVEDEGIGIPADDLPFIFDRFRRGSNVPRRTSGAGIGLAGARQIVEQHGGWLTAASEEGHGARFTLRLPLGDDVVRG